MMPGSRSLFAAVLMMSTLHSVAFGWTEFVGSSSRDDSPSVALDSSGAVFLAGAVTGDVDGQTAQGGDDIGLVKFHANGTRLWTRIFGGPGGDTPPASAVGQSGDVL
jgi:hypothetical protein